MARVQVARGEGLGPDGGRDAQFGAEGAGAVGELADTQLRGRAGQFRDAGQVDLRRLSGARSKSVPTVATRPTRGPMSAAALAATA